MLSCHAATQLLSQRQDRALLLNERTQLTLHLAMCSNCRNFSKQIRELSKLTKQFRDRPIQLVDDED